MKENKILIITTHISPTKGYGGPALSIRKFVDFLRFSDCDFNVISTTNNNSYNNLNEYFYKSYIFHKLGFSPSLFIKLIFSINKHNHIIINGIATFPNISGILLSIIYRKKVSVFARGSFEITRYKNANKLKIFYYKFNFFLLNLLQKKNNLKIIYQSNFEWAKSTKNFNFNHLIVPNFSISEIKRIRNYSSNIRDIDLVYCGRDSYEKGTDRLKTFLTYLLLIKNKLKIFIIIDGPLNYLSDFNFLSNHHDIILLQSEEHENILKIFSRTKFYFFGSRIENFGNAFIESIACGAIPILFSDTDWSYLIPLKLVWEYDDLNLYIEKNQMLPEYSSLLNESLFVIILDNHFYQSNNYKDILITNNEI